MNAEASHQFSTEKRSGLGTLISSLRVAAKSYSVRTRSLRQMDCGWRNPEEATNIYLERQKPLASKADYIEPADQPQTSGMRDVLSPLAMMISSVTSSWLMSGR
jgi:hypothetical protein